MPASPNRSLSKWPLVLVVTLIIVAITATVIVIAGTVNTGTAEAADDDPIAMRERGQRLYATQCAACHGPNGEGVANLGLPLANTAFVRDSTDEVLIDVIKNGRLSIDPANQTGVTMPGMGSPLGLSDTDIRAIIAYLRTLE